MKKTVSLERKDDEKKFADIQPTIALDEGGAPAKMPAPVVLPLNHLPPAEGQVTDTPELPED
jgi:hypothetical protein